MTNVFLDVGFTIAPAPQAVGVIPALPISTAQADWKDYLSRATPTATYDPASSGFSVVAVASAWAAAGKTNNAMRDWCVAQFRKRLSAMRATWAAGGPDYFSDDSYLYAGDRMAELVTVANWWPDQLTAQELADFATMADQCVFNVWNHATATWGGKSCAWSGWATNDPWNNYFHRAHLKATIWWAIHSQSAKWFGQIRNYCLPLMKSKYAGLVGGGSLEGTGYGQEYMSLFQLIWLWRFATGDDLCAALRVPEHVDFWYWVTSPDFKYFAPVGDQSRVSTPSVFDYQRSIMAWATILIPGTVQAQHARAWLTGAGRRAIRPENYWLTCFDTSGTESAPAGLSYFAPGVGMLFAKDTLGNFISFQAGPLVERHNHNAQGELQVYSANGPWRFVTCNIFSASGIEASVQRHNCVLFRTSAGAVIEPDYAPTVSPVMQYTDDGNLLTITVDLKPAYGSSKDILTYTRAVTWNRAAKLITVSDSFTTQNGVTGSWRATANDQTFASQIKCTSGAQALPLVDWKTENVVPFNVDCWRVEFVGATQYTVTISL